MVTYYSVVGWDKDIQRTTRAKWSEIQRLQCIPNTGGMSTTPTAAIETTADLISLHIFLDMETRIFSYRLLTVGTQCIKELRWNKTGLLAEINPYILSMVSESLVSEQHLEKSYIVLSPEKKEDRNGSRRIFPSPRRIMHCKRIDWTFSIYNKTKKKTFF